MAEEPVDWAQQRGVASFDYNGSAVWVKAGVAETAAALARLRGGRVEPDVEGQEVTLTAQCWVVLRLRGHEWTEVIGRDHAVTDAFGELFEHGNVPDNATVRRRVEAARKVDTSEDDAAALSTALGTLALYYGVSDTAGALSYSLYDRGELVQHLSTGEGYEVEAFTSKRGAKEPQDVERHVDALFRELGAYELGDAFMHLVGHVMHEPGQRVRFRGEPGMFERIDFVTT